MIRCQESSASVGDLCDEVTPESRARIAEHLDACRRRRGEIAFLNELRRVVAEAEPELPADVGVRMEAFLATLEGSTDDHLTAQGPDPAVREAYLAVEGPRVRGGLLQRRAARRAASGRWPGRSASATCFSMWCRLPGARVLDVGCGGGIDVLLAARRVGADGHVTVAPAPRDVRPCPARLNAAEAVGLERRDRQYRHHRGGDEAIPLPSTTLSTRSCRTG